MWKQNYHFLRYDVFCVAKVKDSLYIITPLNSLTHEDLEPNKLIIWAVVLVAD